MSRIVDADLCTRSPYSFVWRDSLGVEELNIEHMQRCGVLSDASCMLEPPCFDLILKCGDMGEAEQPLQLSGSWVWGNSQQMNCDTTSTQIQRAYACAPHPLLTGSSKRSCTRDAFHYVMRRSCFAFTPYLPQSLACISCLLISFLSTL